MNEQLLNTQFHLRDRGLSNALSNDCLARHRWYFFKEGFSPRILEAAACSAGLDSDDLIFDPFCGSGTVPLAATLRGNYAIGIEVNPFMQFLARTKLLNGKSARLKKHFERLVSDSRTNEKSALEGFSTFSKTKNAKKWLFNQTVLRTFQSAWDSTSSISNPYRDLLRLALLGAAMDNCNATRDGKCLRYRTDWLEFKFSKATFIESLRARIKMMGLDLEECPVKSPDAATIHLGDSRRMSPTVRGTQKFRLCVTSPPYLNSFDYSDVYRPELFLGKFVSSNEDLRGLRLRTVRSHVQASWTKPKFNSFGTLYAGTMQQLLKRTNHLWDNRIPTMVQAYFEDMVQVFNRLAVRAHEDAHLWLVVSTSAYGGVEVPVDLILAEIGGRCGWSLREIGVLRELRSSSQHWSKDISASSVPRLRESVVIFERDLTKGPKKRGYWISKD